MAGTGPAPKFPEERANRIKPQRGEWREVSIPAVSILPELPDDVRWSTRTQRIWKGWQQDPATTMFGPSEIAMCTKLAFQYEKAIGDRVPWNIVTAWMDKLGLTPKGKLDLRLRVVDAKSKPALASVSKMKRKVV